MNDQGQLVIPADAHIRLASHEENDGTRILRRGYSFTDGDRPRPRHPARRTVLHRLHEAPGAVHCAAAEARGPRRAQRVHPHIGSALFAVPPGLRRGQSWGESLFR